MTAAGFLLVTIVTGAVLAITGIAIARLRRDERYVPGPRRVGRSTRLGVGAVVAFGVVALPVVAVGLAVVDPFTVALLSGPTLVVAYLTWGIYDLARSRGLPRAHSVGLSTWVIGVVLIGAIAVQLLIG